MHLQPVTYALASSHVDTYLHSHIHLPPLTHTLTSTHTYTCFHSHIHLLPLTHTLTSTHTYTCFHSHVHLLPLTHTLTSTHTYTCFHSLTSCGAAVRTSALNRENPGSNPLAVVSKLTISFIPLFHSSLSCINEYLATYRGGYLNE